MKIAIIGAGGYVFPLTLIRDLISFPNLQESEISLMDIDPERLKRTEAGATALIEHFKLPTRLESTTDRRVALNDADFVICTFQVGGLEAYRCDVEIPREYGVDQTVGDTLGPGGIFRGLRTAVVLQEMTRDMHELCPDALMIQYANPMSINCWVSSECGINTIGFCHSVQGTSRMLADEVGVPYDECSFVCAGINHQAWFVKFHHRDEDLIPRIYRVMLEKHLKSEDRGLPADELHPGGSERVRTEIMRLTGYFHSESSHHASEYMPYFRKNNDLTVEYLPERWDYYEICCAHPEDTQNEQYLARAREAGLQPGEEYGAYVIESRVSGVPRVVHGNVRNTGLITNLPTGCCVEVPVTVDREGLRPHFIGDLPPACAAVNRLGVNQQELAVRAALDRDLDMLYAAVAMDPLTSALCTLPQIREMVDRLIDAEQRWLPGFESRRR